MKNDRKARWKRRQATGRRCYTIEADEVELSEKLVAGRFLSPLAADDHEKQREALERMIAALEIK